LRRLAVVLIAGSALVTGCSSGTNTGDDLQVADTVTAATPADSPAQGKTPAGTVLARELLAWADFGYRLGADRPLMALVDDLLETTDAIAA